MSRAYTKEETKAKILKHMKGLATYWGQIDKPADCCQERLNGLVFSILVMFDGGSMGLPAMDIVMRPHAEDEEFNKEQGTNWFEDGLAVNDDTQLHDEFTALEREAGLNMSYRKKSND